MPLLVELRDDKLVAELELLDKELSELSELREELLETLLLLDSELDDSEELLDVSSTPMTRNGPERNRMPATSVDRLTTCGAPNLPPLA